MANRTSRMVNEFADSGATAQEGLLPLYACNACGGRVVWATSSRTGRKYLANAYLFSGGRHSYYYNKRSVHTDEDCANTARRRDDRNEEARRLGLISD